MSIKSHAFGRVTLTGQDAQKFKDQVTYGRPKPAAQESVRRGVDLVHVFKKDGRVRLTLRGVKGRDR